MPFTSAQQHWIFLLKMLGVAALYALLVFLDHRFFESATTISSFEPASGFALGVLLIGGRRYVWGVLLGAIFINSTLYPLGAAVAVSSGNALGVFCGAWLLMYDNKFDPAIRSLRDYLRLILQGGIAGAGIGANSGVLALMVLGFTAPENIFHDLSHWWTGDLLGALLVTPLMLVFWHTKNDWMGMRRMIEAVLLLGVTFLAGQIVFLGWLHSQHGLLQLIAKGYWMFLFIAWIAVRLGTRGTVFALNMMAVQAVYGAYQGVGFFANDIAQTQLANYWFFTVILSVVGMALATYFTELKLNNETLHRSETKLRTLYESTSDAVMLVDEKGFLDCNKAALAMFGYDTKEELCSRNPADISPPVQPCGTDSMTLVKQNNAKAIKEGSNHFEWVCHNAATGKIFPVEVLLNKMQLDGRTVLQATVRDITERKLAEEKIHERDELLRETQSVAGLGSYILDIPTGLWESSGVLDKLFGINETFVRSVDEWEAMTHPDDRAMMVDYFRHEVLGQGKAFDREYRIIRHDDREERWMHGLGRLKLDAQGRPVKMLGTIQDITERKRSEQSLRTLSTAIEQTPITVVITDKNANIQYVNPCFTKITGYTSDEVHGKNPRILQSGQTAKETYADMWRKITGGNVWHGEFINRRKDGELYWEEAHIAPVTDLAGNITHFVCLKIDISERVKSRQAIERANLLYKMLSEMNSSSIRIRDRSYLFDAACQIAVGSGLFCMAWIGLLDQESGNVSPVAQAGHVGDYLDNIKINIYRDEGEEESVGMAIRGRHHVNIDDIANHPSMRPWREHTLKQGYRAKAIFPLTERGQVIGVFNLYFHETGLLTDDVIQLLDSMAADTSFTLDFIAEARERETAQREIQEMSVFLQHARENERKHIARELHDELGQTITAMRFDLNWLHENPGAQKNLVGDKLLSMGALLNHTVETIRRISEDLRPGMLDDLGLAAAIENHVAEFVGHTGIACNLSMNQPGFDLDDLVATALFRIIQESLTNVARHAGANQVNIHLHKTESRMLLAVQDNGCGFQPDQVAGNKKTYGLLGMRERVKILGGTLDILTEPGAGTRIEASIPIDIIRK